MGSISNIKSSGNLPGSTQSMAIGERYTKEAAALIPSHPSRLDDDEAYITSCRPTRLSMEMIARIRANSGK